MEWGRSDAPLLALGVELSTRIVEAEGPSSGEELDSEVEGDEGDEEGSATWAYEGASGACGAPW